MATWSLSLNAGETEFKIVEGTDAPTTGDIELTVNVANMPGNTGGTVAPNSAILLALKMFENFIMGKSKVIY